MRDIPDKLEQLKSEIRSKHFSQFLPNGLDGDTVIEAFEREAKKVQAEGRSRNRFRHTQVSAKRS